MFEEINKNRSRKQKDRQYNIYKKKNKKINNAIHNSTQKIRN